MRPDCTCTGIVAGIGDTAVRIRTYQNLWSGDAMWYAEFGQYYGQGKTRKAAIASLKIRLNQVGVNRLLVVQE